MSSPGKAGLCLVAIFLLCACGDDPPKEPPRQNAIQSPGPRQSGRQQPAERAAGMDAKTADAILAFHNQASEAFSKGYYSLPQTIAANVSSYLETWKLPKKLPAPAQGEKLAPPAGVFSEEEEKQLSSARLGMDQARQAMLNDYRSLEAYVVDGQIRDDGERGAELARRIFEGRDVFMAARKSWLEIVEHRAAEAESALLEKHPLRRQALAARGVLAIISQVSDLVAAGSADRELLGSLRQSLDQSISEGEKPPFPAQPQLERLYRGFMKNSRAYSEVLARCEREGIWAPQRKELAAAAQACRRAYNSFAHAVNAAPAN